MSNSVGFVNNNSITVNGPQVLEFTGERDTQCFSCLNKIEGCFSQSSSKVDYAQNGKCQLLLLDTLQENPGAAQISRNSVIDLN